MNDFFDTLGAAARRAADSVCTEVSIAAHEQKVKEGYQALGKLYYRYVSSGMMPEGSEFDGIMARVAEELAEIDRLRKQRDVTADRDGD